MWVRIWPSNTTHHHTSRHHTTPHHAPLITPHTPQPHTTPHTAHHSIISENLAAWVEHEPYFVLGVTPCFPANRNDLFSSFPSLFFLIFFHHFSFLYFHQHLSFIPFIQYLSLSFPLTYNHLATFIWNNRQRSPTCCHNTIFNGICKVIYIEELPRSMSLSQQQQRKRKKERCHYKKLKTCDTNGQRPTIKRVPTRYIIYKKINEQKDKEKKKVEIKIE